MRYEVSIDGGPAVVIEASSSQDAAEQAAFCDETGWSDGSYRGGEAVAIVTDSRDDEQAFLLDGDESSFCAWYLG